MERSKYYLFGWSFLGFRIFVMGFGKVVLFLFLDKILVVIFRVIYSLFEIVSFYLRKLIVVLDE